MPGAHRDGDDRFCGAATTVLGQSTVLVDGKLWAVDGDPETHGGGDLVPVYGSLDVYAEGKLVIVAVGDSATSDDEGHEPSETSPSGHSDDVSAY